MCIRDSHYRLWVVHKIHWLQHSTKMTLIDFNQKELLDIYRALQYTRFEECPTPHSDEGRELYHRLTNLMEKVSKTRSMCNCKENVSEWTLLLLSDWPTTPMKLLSGMIVTPKPQGVKQICDNSTSCTIWLDYGRKSTIMSIYRENHYENHTQRENDYRTYGRGH